jgi:hypothetical protein
VTEDFVAYNVFGYFFSATFGVVAALAVITASVALIGVFLLLVADGMSVLVSRLPFAAVPELVTVERDRRS